MSTSISTVLLCTVGGSHAPVLTAIGQQRPDHVIFVCSGRDPGTGRPGSDKQVLGCGPVIKASPEDKHPALPSIPVQAGLPEERYEVLIVPSDDLDDAFKHIQERLHSLRQEWPNARLVADYTGGTKSMSAAVVAAVLEEGGVDLQIVTGNRADLVKVLDGTEYPAVASVESIRMRRALAQHLGSWRRYAYDEAVAGLERVAAPRDRELRADLSRARDLSAAFAAWDRFDHAEAQRRLQPYAPLIAAHYSPYIGAMKALTAPEDNPRREPLLIWDLWLNAQRRAVQGRFDDAVARCYRLLEWTAQWLLRTRHGIDTGDVPHERVPAGIELAPNRDGTLQAGLYSAWRMLSALDREGLVGQFMAREEGSLLNHLQRRNASILAHGFQPVQRTDWESLQGWMEKSFMPLLRDAATRAGVRHLPPQLPAEPFATG